jgi:hypothetical protein
MTALWRRFHFLFFIAAGLLIMGLGWLHYFSPTTRLELYGVKLENRVALLGPTRYLLGWHAQVESWTEQDGRLDTPLVNETRDEISTLSIERQRGTPATDILLVKPQEWILSLKNADGFKNETLSLNHPSIAQGTVLLDKQGTLLERQRTSAWRVDRALQFIFPKFPKGALRPGETWTEHVEWTEPISEWKIGWQADIHWTLKNYDLLYEKPCAHLIYEAELTPSMVQNASWAGQTSQAIHFEGQASGEALYDVRDKFLISNTFSYAGILKIRVPNLANVPDELRVGIAPAPSQGDVLLKINDKMDARLP